MSVENLDSCNDIILFMLLLFNFKICNIVNNLLLIVYNESMEYFDDFLRIVLYIWNMRLLIIYYVNKSFIFLYFDFVFSFKRVFFLGLNYLLEGYVSLI